MIATSSAELQPRLERNIKLRIGELASELQHVSCCVNAVMSLSDMTALLNKRPPAACTCVRTTFNVRHVSPVFLVLTMPSWAYKLTNVDLAVSLSPDKSDTLTLHLCMFICHCLRLTTKMKVVCVVMVVDVVCTGEVRNLPPSKDLCTREGRDSYVIVALDREEIFRTATVEKNLRYLLLARSSAHVWCSV